MSEDNIEKLDDLPAPPELSQDVIALINNGLEFLDKAREELEARKPKFSVVSFWTAVEILLKVPLAHEHWSLVCSGKKIVRQKYMSGDFQSITFHEACDRLSDVLEKPLPADTFKAFDKIRQHRNRVVHFYHPSFTSAELDQILKEQADAWFALNRLIRDKWQDIFGPNHGNKLALGETRTIQGNAFYAALRLEQLRPELEELVAQEAQIESCPDCHQKTKVVTVEKIGNEGHELKVTRCILCTSSSRMIFGKCPRCGKHQCLSEEEKFKCLDCSFTSDIFELLDEKNFYSVVKSNIQFFLRDVPVA